MRIRQKLLWLRLQVVTVSYLELSLLLPQPLWAPQPLSLLAALELLIPLASVRLTSFPFGCFCSEHGGSRREGLSVSLRQLESY